MIQLKGKFEKSFLSWFMNVKMRTGFKDLNENEQINYLIEFLDFADLCVCVKPTRKESWTYEIYSRNKLMCKDSFYDSREDSVFSGIQQAIERYNFKYS